MKRHPALAPLSRDHHHALVLARKLRRANAQDAADVSRAFLEHWMEEERLHFRLEEEVLLPAFAAYGDPNGRGRNRRWGRWASASANAGGDPAGFGAPTPPADARAIVPDAPASRARDTRALDEPPLATGGSHGYA